MSRFSFASFLCGATLLLVLPALGTGKLRSRFHPATPAQQAKSGSGYVLFRLDPSSAEREFASSLKLDGVRVVALSDLKGAEARRFEIRETPTLVRLDANEGVTGRWNGTRAITEVLGKSQARGKQSSSSPAYCSTRRIPRLRWVEEADRRAAWVYRRFNGGRDGVPDIFKTMSLRPELMEGMLDLSERGHFSDGYLNYRTKERLATLVSALNHSNYCRSSHAAGLAALGARPSEITSLAAGKIDSPSISSKERALLGFACRLTQNPSGHITEDVQHLREAGWRDEQIFEAAFDVSLFNFFNRMAATYDLETPQDGWKPTLVARRPAASPLPQ